MSSCFHFSGSNKDRGVHMTTLACAEGGVTWYNPNGALSLELRPENPGRYRTCYKVDSEDVKLKISREGELNVNSKSPNQRSKHIMNDHNLQTLSITEGKSQEICIEATNGVILYLEPEYKETIGYQKIVFQYDSAIMHEDEEESSIEGKYLQINFIIIRPFLKKCCFMVMWPKLLSVGR